jgi:beta-glucanase (GH16 family)
VPAFSDSGGERPAPRGGHARHLRGAWLPALSLVIGAVIALVSFLLTTPANSHDGSTSHRHHPSSTTSTPSVPRLPPPGMHVAFLSTFNGPTLDRHVWFPCYPFITAATGCTNYGNKQEVEWYIPAQVRTDHGILELTAEPVPTVGKAQSGAPKTFPYRSGLVTTYPAYRFTYGYVQVVARVPHQGAQFWPAVWLLPSTGASLPEVDIVEVFGNDTHRSGAFLHPVSGPAQGTAFPTATLSTGWHTFGLDWGPGFLTWYVDGQPIFTTETGVPHQAMYILINLAATDYVPACLGTSPPLTCTGTFSVKSLDVWQK